MVMAANQRSKTKLSACVFTLEEIKRYWRRAQMHIAANNGERLVALANEFSRELDCRQCQEGEVHLLAELLEHKQVVDALARRGMHTAEDVVSRGIWAIVNTRLSPKRIRNIWELCNKTVSTTITKE